MSVEGDPIGFAQSTKMDGVNIKPVDLSVQAIQQGCWEQRCSAGCGRQDSLQGDAGCGGN